MNAQKIKNEFLEFVAEVARTGEVMTDEMVTVTMALAEEMQPLFDRDGNPRHERAEDARFWYAALSIMHRMVIQRREQVRDNNNLIAALIKLRENPGDIEAIREAARLAVRVGYMYGV